MTAYEILRGRVLAWVREKKIGPVELARRLGYEGDSRSWGSQFMKGTKVIPMNRLDRVAKMLDVSVSDLFVEEGPRSDPAISRLVRALENVPPSQRAEVIQHRLTLEHAKAAVRLWREKGRVIGKDADGAEIWRPYAAWTIRHFVNALRQLYRGIDGADAPTPVDGLQLGKPPQTTPVFVTPATIVDVAANLLRIAETPDPRRTNHKAEWMKTRARHMVLAAHGVRPIELERAQPEDVNVKERIWPIRTAKGGIGRVLRLNTPEMRDACKAFIAANAWGPFDRSRHAKRLRRAGWPKGVRPYSLRGTWGMEISRRGADLADIQPLMGHADIRTTRAYYVPAESSRLAQATKATAGRLRWRRR